ncbi:MAG: DUF1932 domain-containing protein [Sphaerochaetaceae bacterium]|nr:DUF1932 domain-containing protein [Sphaerochaetaceae bacterium]
MENVIAFIGFGEAAYNISKGLKEEGLKCIGAYDVKTNDPDTGHLIRERAVETGVTLYDSLEKACRSAKLIASLTSAGVAVKVAKSVLPYLEAGQTFIDMNSAAPDVKEEIEEINRKDGVLVCDAAVMGTVPQNRHKVKMFLSGSGSRVFHDAMMGYGMNLEVLDVPMGGASAIKMFKSIVMKGLPQLMFESMTCAHKYGVLDSLVKSLNDSLHGKTIEQLSDTFFARTIIHAKRRAVEMENVIATVESIGMDASMAAVTKMKLENLEKSGLKDLIGTRTDMDYKSVLELVNRKEMKDEQ